MKLAIVNISEIAACPQRRLDPEHWIDEHKVEECDPELIKLAKEARVKRSIKKVKAIARIEGEYQNELLKIRHGAKLQAPEGEQ